VNIQPYGIPEGHWPPLMTPWWFHFTKPVCRKALRKQKIFKIQAEDLHHLQQTVDAKHGIMLTPNHSFHWDSYCLVAATEKMNLPFYIMTAWQVFATSSWFERYSMQRCGCFSVDREGTDMHAMKTAVDVLQNRKHPLVIFPEGDVYHMNDRVTPFRDGAAAMGLMAARKSTRPVSIIPVAIKRWYSQDPTPSLLKTIEVVEQRLFWRPQSGLPLTDRIIHVAHGILCLKELEHLRETHQGSLSERIDRLSSAILSRSEKRYGLTPKATLIPERVKEVRRTIIAARESQGETASQAMQQQWTSDMDDMFLVTQLYSYPGNYLLENPSVERIAETLDKLEEDALGAVYPTVHGEREVVVRFGKPIELPMGKEKKLSAPDLTDQMEQCVQSMLDDMNAKRTGAN
jgi:1-acyl-sn-glycerol-3-phosphate acyltransferase